MQIRFEFIQSKINMFLLSKTGEMKIGLVIHGPEVIDSGKQKKSLRSFPAWAKWKQSSEELWGR